MIILKYKHMIHESNILLDIYRIFFILLIKLWLLKKVVVRND